MTTNSFSALHVAGDHAGIGFKETIKALLSKQNWELTDHGTHSDASCDYPDYVHPLAAAVASDPSLGGILFCGSGNGVCITANKYKNIRAALCWNVELAKLARQHNNANVICIPTRFVSEALAAEMVEAFLTTEFEGGRHLNRVNKITDGLK
jgi:ribose 5-phosphate isomerase B